jgi:hypothetical protein
VPKSDWRVKTVSLNSLRDAAKGYPEGSVFDWLKDIGLVPDSVNTAKVAQVRTNIDGHSMPVGYIASAAFEWDSWGRSAPSDFVEAIEFETAGNTKRDFVSNLLISLGQSVDDEEDGVTYKLHLPN